VPRSLKQIFAGFKRGDIVTGTVHLFGLNTGRLQEQKIIAPEEIRPVTERITKVDRIIVQGTGEWVFNGFQH